MRSKKFLALAICSLLVCASLWAYTKQGSDPVKIPRQIFVCGSDWVPPCRAMNHLVWSDPEIQKECSKYIGGKPKFIEMSNKEFLAGFQVQVAPAIIMTNIYGKEVRRAYGYLTKTEVLKFLRGETDGLKRLEKPSNENSQLPIFKAE
jgi:hypothetical protein